MFRNYLKTALRNIARHKSNSIINIAGLMVGFAAFLLIFLVIQYEQSFDNFHLKKNNIYRVVRIGKNPINREYRAGVPFPVTQGLRDDFQQLTKAAAIYGTYNVQVNVLATDGSSVKKFKEKKGVFIAEPQFFQMFDFPLAEGNLMNAISLPNTALLTKDIATKYFGDWKTAMGKIIKLLGYTIKVTGILDNPPANTDFPLGIVLSYATLSNRIQISNWGNIDDNNYCFVQLPENYSKAQFDRLLTGFVNKHIRPINPGYDLSLQPLKEIHYDARLGNFNGRTFSKDLILALSLICLFLIILACVNFVNLTTAQAINRSREVGVRKVLGGSRSQLIGQFLGETGITSFLALSGALIIVLVCFPFVNNLLEIHLTRSILFSPKLILILLGALLLVTMLSGFYPALVMSGFKLVNVLKTSTSGDSKKGISLRRGLVVFQFVIAQALIIGTLVVTSQMNYFRTADMGFNKQAVINVGIPDDSLSRSKVSVLQNELTKVPGIEQVSFSTFAPSGADGWYTDLRIPSNLTNNPDMIICMKPADTNFFNLYNLHLLAGRIYFPSDTMREFVVNEMVVKNLGINRPEDAIGKLINVDGSIYPIVGVIHDFHANSLRDPINPVVMTTIKRAYGLANIKINMSKAKSVLADMERIWNANFPNIVFEYDFLDQSIANYYRQENQLSQLYKIFSFIAIFLSCLGLYGLISFIAVQRRKEIGIRKVLGAPVREIVWMLSREFTMLIGIAFLIAAPIAWHFMHLWLEQYTFRIMIGLSFFAVTIVGSLSLAWLSVGFTALKAALDNPVKCLRTE